MQITVRYQLNGDDGLECLRLHDPSFQSKGLVGTLASLAIVVIGLLFLMLPGEPVYAWVAIAIGLVLLALGITQKAVLVSRLRRQWNQMDPMELTVRDAGLVATTRGSHTDVQWSRFQKFREGKNHFLLYSSPDLYSVVPKRGFTSQADLDAFRDLLAQRTGES